jgi:hypothetical protein
MWSVRSCPILYVDEVRQRRSRIPLNYRFVRALRRYREAILALDAPLYIQRAEHGLPFLREGVPLYFNTHGQSALWSVGRGIRCFGGDGSANGSIARRRA